MKHTHCLRHFTTPDEIHLNVITTAEAAAQALAIARQHGITAYDLGYAVAAPEGCLWIKPKELGSPGNALVLANS